MQGHQRHRPEQLPANSAPQRALSIRRGRRARSLTKPVAAAASVQQETTAFAAPSTQGVRPDDYPTIEATVGQTPLVRLQRMNPNPSNVVLCKLEGNNPAGSVKDRPALSMISEAESKGLIKPGDTLIEATSGNTGIALAMACAIKGYRLKLIMPSNMSEERRQSMAAYGAELISVGPGQMEAARDLAKAMEARGEGRVLDQFGNLDNPLAHERTTGPELWQQTHGRITHFVSSMGTTGTIMGTSRFLKTQNPGIQIVGLQPAEGSQIAGIRRWPTEYLPKIFDASRVDRVMEISSREADETMRAVARCEGIFAGVSSGGAISAALRLSAEVNDAVICVIVCDRGDRYLSTGGFSAEAGLNDPRPCPAGEFWSAAARLITLPGPRYVYFTADPDASGKPWCGDCARSIDAVREGVRRTGGTLLEVHVGPREAWKRPDHPFRTHPLLRLGGIPTLMEWGVHEPTRRAGPELERSKTPEEAASVVDAFLAASSSTSSSSSSAGQHH